MTFIFSQLAATIRTTRRSNRSPQKRLSNYINEEPEHKPYVYRIWTEHEPNF